MFIKDIINVTNGELMIGDINLYIKSFSIDSRTIKENELYVSIIGDNFSGNDFIINSFNKGASGVIYQGKIDNTLLDKFKDKVFIKVNNTIKALQDMAKYKRSLYDIPVVAITGSVGKTSTKDLISSVMGEKYNVLSTIGNFNNHIGLPLTLLKLDKHDAMCIEIGMNHSGELSILTDILKPTIAVITNIGTAHIGNLGSRENILKAKLEILEGLNKNGCVVINNDNDLLHNWYLENKDYKVLTYGIENDSDFNAKNINYGLSESEFNTLYDGKECKVSVKVPGKHFVYNSLCALTVGNILGIDEESIKKGIYNFELTKGRMEERKMDDNVTLLVDCYNANYDSMVSALEVLGKYNTRKIAVLGDMLELGEFSTSLHLKVGEVANKNNVDILITVGDLSKYIVKGYNRESVYQCVNNEEVVKILKSIIKKDDIILFKASNSMKFIEIVEKL